MPLPSSINDLSQTAGSNSPSGSEAPSLIDDYLRTYASYIAQHRDGKGFALEATVASAATCEIGAANSLIVQITGTTGITSFGTTYSGPRIVRFAAALTLTHSATLVLPGAANITVAAGDFLIAVPNGNPASGWRVVIPPTSAGYTQQQNGQLAGMRNKIINGKMEIAQRGTTVSLTTSGQFSLDRWVHAWDGTGATRAAFKQDFPPGTGPETIRSFLSYAQSAAGSGGTFNALEQRIEGVDNFAGQTVTLSFYARNNATTPLPQIICRQFFGSSGSATVNTTVATNVATTASFTRYTFTFTVPSTVGKTVAGGNDYLSILILLPINSVLTFDITGVQLEVGALATPFEQRLIGQELSLCRRYTRVQAYQVPATTAQNLGTIDMRSTPTITGGGAGFTSTDTTADQLIAFQTAAAVQTLTLVAEL